MIICYDPGRFMAALSRSPMSPARGHRDCGVDPHVTAFGRCYLELTLRRHSSHLTIELALLAAISAAENHRAR